MQEEKKEQKWFLNMAVVQQGLFLFVFETPKKWKTALLDTPDCGAGKNMLIPELKTRRQVDVRRQGVFVCFICLFFILNDTPYKSGHLYLLIM